VACAEGCNVSALADTPRVINVPKGPKPEKRILITPYRNGAPESVCIYGGHDPKVVFVVGVCGSGSRTIQNRGIRVDAGGIAREMSLMGRSSDRVSGPQRHSSSSENQMTRKKNYGRLRQSAPI